MSLIRTAKALVKKGISVVATDNNKRAIISWKKFQETLPTPEELESQFQSEKAKGIAIICGQVSGNLEVIDVDTKYDTTGTLFEELTAAIHDVSKELSDKLMIVQTKSGGYHIYYRCSVIHGNQKLAQRPATAEEIKENPNEKVLVLIETRGEGGYVVAPPTEGYKKIQGDTIHDLTPEEREVLLELSRSFNQYIIEQPKPAVARSVTEHYAVTPWEDYNRRGVDDMLDRLQKHGWIIVSYKGDKIIFKRPGKTESKTSGDYHRGHNLFTVFTTSSVFEALKGYKPAAVFTMLECNGDFKAAAKKLSEIGYGEKPIMLESKMERELFQKKQEGYSREDLVKFIKSRKDMSTDKAEETVDGLDTKWGNDLKIFWDVKIDNENKKKIDINRNRFINFLNQTGGFGLYFYDKNSTIHRIVRISDGFVEEASTEQMKKFILQFIDGLPDAFDGGITPDLLKELVMRQYNSLFNQAFLEFCPREDPDFLKDDLEKSYFPFRNGVVVVTKDNIELVSYRSIEKHIWKSQVIDFNISIDQDFEVTDSEFFSFIHKICAEEDERWMYCLTLIGYLLHKYKDPARPYSVIFAEETESDAEGGGTGKGILVKALSYLMNTERIDGKNFSLSKNFAFQRVNLDTKLISIEDVRKNVDFEGFFSIITEGITVEKKNKDELYIPFKDSPKILFTTNYTISSNTKAAQRRQKVFEFAPFFGPKFTPKDFFHHNLFDDWDKDEWNRFYNLMFACVSMYMSVGIKEVDNSEKIKRKHIRLSFGEEYFENWEHYSQNGCEEWKPFKELYHSFMIENDFDKKDYNQKRFKKALQISSELFGWKLETKRGETIERVVMVRINKKP